MRRQAQRVSQLDIIKTLLREVSTGEYTHELGIFYCH